MMATRINLAANVAVLLVALPANAHASGGIGMLVFIAAPFVMIPLAFYSASLLWKPSLPGQPLRPGEFSAITASATLEGLYAIFGFMPMITAWTADRGIVLGSALFWFASASLIIKLYLFFAGRRQRKLTETE